MFIVPDRRVRAYRAGDVPFLDVADWFIPKPGHFTKNVFVRLLADLTIAVYYIKTPVGGPFDVDLITASGIYFRVTENDAVVNGVAIGWPPAPGWQNTYRLYTPPFKMFPRFYNPQAGRTFVSSVPNLQTQRYSACGTFVVNSLGPAESWVNYQPAVNFGGDLGACNSIVGEYYYNPIATARWKTRELFYLVYGSGWVRWTLQNSPDGVNWTVVKDVIANKYLNLDPALVPVQPCPVQL